MRHAAPEARVVRNGPKTRATGRRDRVRNGMRGGVSAGARRGMSFLEVVVALAILSMIAATSMSAISSITGQARAARQRMAAMELANRLVLQYMDDPTRMPRAELPIEYAQERYRWRLHEGSVSMVPVIAPEERTTLGPRRLDRFKTVSITVWLGEESGGTWQPEVGTPGAVLTRLMDPYALRNPDAIERLTKDPERLRSFLEAFTGGAPAAPPGSGSGTTPGGSGSGGGKPGGARPASGSGATRGGGDK